MSATFPKFYNTVSDSSAAIVLILDLENFTSFVNDQNGIAFIPQVLQKAFAIIEENFSLTSEFEIFRHHKGFQFKLAGTELIHSKFLGDGLLLIWPVTPASLPEMYIRLLCMCSSVRREFHARLLEINGISGQPTIPKNVRFGIAFGKVHKLTNGSTDGEFVGTPINLASRLQGYCRPLGLMASFRSLPEYNMPSEEELNSHGFQILRVKAIKGFFEAEKIIAEIKAYERLDRNMRLDLFAEIED